MWTRSDMTTGEWVGIIATVLLLVVLIILLWVGITSALQPPPTCPDGYVATYIRGTGWVCTVKPLEP
jgi:hypothetical protein